MSSSPRSLGTGFSALLMGTFVTNIGDGIRLAALPLLGATLTTSPLLIGGITAAQYLPWALFGPFGGVIVDRSDRRRLIMTVQMCRAVVMATLGVLVFIDVIEVWHVFVVAFLITVGEILVDPSVVATIPRLVKPTDLDRANGRITSVEVVTNEFAGGPLGAATFTVAPWLPFVIDALTYLGSTAPFSRVPTFDPLEHDRDRSRLSELRAGFGWVLGHDFLRPLTLGIAVYHLGTAGAMGLLVLLVTDVLGGSTLLFGMVLLAAATGAAVASLVAPTLTDRWTRRTIISGGAVIAAVSLASAGAAQTVWQLVIVWVIYGAASAVLTSIGRGFIQRYTPNDRLGRASVASRTMTRSFFVAGALFAGTVGVVSSVRWSFAVAGGFHLLGAALLWRSFKHEPVEELSEAAASD